MFGIKKDINKDLIKFSTKGKIDKVKMLIQSGANVNYRDEKGWTPTHGASSQGCIEVLELLLSEGAELDAVTNKGMTLLHTVALYSSDWQPSSGCDIRECIDQNLTNDRKVFLNFLLTAYHNRNSHKLSDYP
jgi:hypothetical protein